MNPRNDFQGLIGKNISVMPGNELIDILEEKDTWPTKTCWFCEKRPALTSSVLSQPLAKVIDRRVNGDGYHNDYIYLMVVVPRCLECKRVHRLRKIAPYISLPVWFVVTGGPLWLMARLGIDFNLLLYAFFFVLGLVVYSITWNKLLPEIMIPGSKETKDQELWEWNFPGMKEVKDAGFSKYIS